MSEPATELNIQDPAALVSTLLGTRMSERARKALTAYVLGVAAYSYGRKAWNKYHKASTFVVSVADSDGIYPEIQQWLLDLIPDHKRASLAARSSRSIMNRRGLPEEEESSLSGESEKRQHLFLAYDGSRDQTVKIDGHNIIVSVNSPDRPVSSSDDDFRSWMNKSTQIQFSAKDQTGRDVVIAFLSNVATKYHSVDRTPNFYLASPWGDWMRRNDLPRRDPSTVILPGGQMERLLADLKLFRGSEDRYARLGVPYHRGYLLHGPAGTGKTSIARAIATHFAMDVYFLTLSDLDKDARLLQMVSAVTPGSMLLLEDIDVLHATGDRSQDKGAGDEKGRISLSGLLNALDGVASPHGLVVFMTTNYVERLDPALIRPGRVDAMEHIGTLSSEQLDGLFKMTFDYVPNFPPLPEASGLTASAVVGILKQNLDNSDDAFKALSSMLEEGAGLR